MKKLNPFVAKVNEQSLAKATVFRQKQARAEHLRNMQTNSLDFAGLEDEAMDDVGGDFGEMDVHDSALDMLGEAEHAQDDIEAKMDLE